MCGIAGILGSGRTVRRPILEKIANSLEHRGPDNKGIETISVDQSQDRILGLVHRRLSIIDLSEAAHQPMHDPETGNWIVFNGEIYNYREIREVLVGDGHRFKTNSDTEVILTSYAKWGEDCLSKLRGMFAFALWCAREKKLFLAIDRVGIKPLYFCKGESGAFVFSSEVRALLHSGVVEREIEPLAIDSFLSYGAIQAPLTMIKGVYSLRPAHYLTYSQRSGDIDVTQYWTPKVGTLSGTDSNSHRHAREYFESVLKEAVRHHLVSDVPLGIFLSGGIDSSALAILVSQLGGGNGLESFTVTFPESSYSEGKYSRLVADKFSADHHEIELSESDLQGILPQAMEAMDQPTVDGINVYILSKAVHEKGFKAVLSGQGSDELFGGYNTFRRIPLLKRFVRCTQTCLGNNQRSGLADWLSRLLQHSTFGSKLFQCMGSNGHLLDLYLISRQLFNPHTKNHLIDTEESVLRNGTLGETADWLVSEIKGLDTFSGISLLEMRCYLANMLLRDGDMMSMAHGLEIRVPFLDHKLIECVFSMPSDTKLHNRLPKPLLVHSVIDQMPKEIYQRSKMGFTFPWEIWLRNQLRYQVDDLLHETPDSNQMGLNMEECRKLWKRFLCNKSGMTWSRAWALYILLFWVRKNIST